jgi:hypothetical protein
LPVPFAPARTSIRFVRLSMVVIRVAAFIVILLPGLAARLGV